MTMYVMTTGGVGILAVALAATAALRRAPASLRHLIWLAALAAVLALPLLEGSGIDVEVPVPTGLLLAASRPEAPGTESPSTGAQPAQWAASVGPAVSRGGERDPGPVATASAVESRLAGVSGLGRRFASGSAAGSGRAPQRREPTSATVEPRASSAGSGSGSLERPEAGAVMGTGRSPLALAGLLLMGLWTVGALGLLARAALGQLRARRLTLRHVTRPPASTSRRLDRLAADLRVDRPVRLVVSRRLRVPATWGVLRPTVVLPADYAHWSPETLDRVLLHELAHVRRGDCAAYLLGEIARAVHWPNPLAWLALDRLRLESERASDDLVLTFMDGPSAYAQDLVSIARAVGRTAEPPRAVLAMASRSGVPSRVRAILDPGQRRGRVRMPVVVIVAFIAVGLASAATVLTPVAYARETSPAGARVDGHAAAMASAETGRKEAVTATKRDTRATQSLTMSGMSAPGVARQAQERLCVFQDDVSRSTSMHVDNEEVRIRWATDDCRVDVDIEGRVEFAIDDTDVVGLDRGALFEIEERLGRASRRVRIERGAGDVVERRYWRDGEEVAWGDESRRWLAQILPEVFRHSTINAEARVGRMLDEGGPDQVFREVEQIRSDHVKARYLELTMQLAQLNEAQYRRIIEIAGSIESDHGSAELLMAVVAEAGLRPAFQDPLLRASEGLDSDHERTRVLQALLDSPLDADQLDAVLHSASSIESDHNLSELLSQIAREGRLDDAGRASFLQALRSIESDHSHGVVVHAFLDAGPLSDGELAQVLAMTEGIESDHERGEILRRVAEEYTLTGAQVTAYLRSASKLSSDHESAETAKAVIERAEFDAEQTGLVLRMADGVSSDHQRGEILQALVRRRDLAPDEVAGLLGAARGIGSDHTLGETLSALIGEQDLDSAAVEGVLTTLEQVGSDHERARVMTALAGRFAIEGRARALYEDLANELGRHDRERVLAAISG